MAPVQMPYLQVYKSRGTTFHYYRRDGRRIRLKGEPGSREFLAAYEAARTAVKTDEPTPERRSLGPPPPLPGSLRALVQTYKASPDYQQLGRQTRADYARFLDPLVDKAGDRPVAQLPRDWIQRRQAELIATPRTANYLVAVIRRLLSFGVDRGMLQHNPALRIKPLRTGPGHRVWTDAEVAALTAPAAGDVALPVLLALHTAQRQVDVLRLLWSAYDGRTVTLIQGKTRQPVIVPVHPDLAAVLDAMPRTAAVICVTASGRPWTSNWFRHRFAQERARAGLATDLHFHGLRHSAASRLAEAGASDSEIQAITGHKTRDMVERYTRGARQAKLASAGIARLPQRANTGTGSV